MERIITYEKLRQFTYSNDHLIQGPIRGIVLDFFGLGEDWMYDRDLEEGIRLAKQGVIFLTPYTNPWCWMNDIAVQYVDEIIAVLQAHYGFGRDIPIVSCGRSMGGLSAIVYCRYAAITPTACVANCPVCDMPTHIAETDEYPHSMYNAFFYCDGTLEEALRAHSPLHLVEELPKIPYTIIHCTADKSVNIDIHSRPFVKAMEPLHTITYMEVEGYRHCELTREARALFDRAILQGLGL